MQSPSVEVVCSRNCTSRTLQRTDRPVLIEGCGPLDGRCVDALSFVDVVGSSITDDGTLEREAGAGIVRAKVFDDVVLNQRIGCPTVNPKVGVARRIEDRGVVDCPRTILNVIDGLGWRSL